MTTEPNIPAFMDLLADSVQQLNKAVAEGPPEGVMSGLSYLTGIAAAGQALYGSQWAIYRTWRSGPVYAYETAPEGPEDPTEDAEDIRAPNVEPSPSRPADYADRTPREQWEIDKELGLLDEEAEDAP